MNEFVSDDDIKFTIYRKEKNIIYPEKYYQVNFKNLTCIFENKIVLYNVGNYIIDLYSVLYNMITPIQNKWNKFFEIRNKYLNRKITVSSFHMLFGTLTKKSNYEKIILPVNIKNRKFKFIESPIDQINRFKVSETFIENNLKELNNFRCKLFLSNVLPLLKLIAEDVILV